MTVANKTSLFSLITANEPRLRALGVRQIGVFGSFVRNEQTPESDVDLFVEFLPNKKTFDNFSKLSDFLEDLAGRKVEIVTRESLSPFIGPHILREVEYVPLPN